MEDDDRRKAVAAGAAASGSAGGDAPAPAPADIVFDERYRAITARDARFDGQFITGIHSRGIYCRPSCPAITPKRSTVSFYLTAAAAHSDGLRACTRCLPDAVPGAPEWDVRDDVAARAMRLIADGVVDREGVHGLARHLGYTPRHLTRVVTESLGAGPLALARAHRAQTARTLLTSTDLPVGDVAFASGFGSIRQFNDTVRALYDHTPRQLRAAGARHGAHDAAMPAGAGTPVALFLPARAPFDGAGVLEWLSVRALRGVECARGVRYQRTLSLPGGVAWIDLGVSVDAARPGVECRARLADVADLAPLIARVRRLFDLDADAVAIDRVLQADPALTARVRARPGVRVPGCLDPHELLIRALLGQQVSVAAARTAGSRLVDALGAHAEFGGLVWRVFPRAAAIAEHGRGVLRGPRRRIETILTVSEALASGALRLDAGRARADLEAALRAIPGIGPWTAGYVSMRVSRSPDILLTGDSALRAGAARLGLSAAPRELDEYARRWAPWRSYASMHLWSAASGPVAAGAEAR